MPTIQPFSPILLDYYGCTFGIITRWLMEDRKKYKTGMENDHLPNHSVNYTMASILPQPNDNSNRKQHSLKIDMTPMVDLGFLLITFFIFTTSMTEPKATKLVMPKDGIAKDVPASKAFTALLAKDKIYVYGGSCKEALAAKQITVTNYNVNTGMGNSLRQKQQAVKNKTGKNDIVFIIKPLSTSSYQNVLSAVDEVMINNIQYYAVVNSTKEEEEYCKINE